MPRPTLLAALVALTSCTATRTAFVEDASPDVSVDTRPLCLPNDRVCDPSGVPSVCNDTGTALIPGVPCEAGSRCEAGACHDRCREYALTRSFMGCDYWSTSLVNSSLGAVLSDGMQVTSTVGTTSFPFGLSIANPWSTDVHVRVEGPDTLREITLPARGVSEVQLPWIDGVSQVTRAGVAHRPGASSFVARGAYHVVSDLPVAVHQYNSLRHRALDRPECGGAGEVSVTCFSYSNDASLLLPTHALGRRYVALAWPSWGVKNAFGDEIFSYGGFVTIVGSDEAPTRVTVRLRADLEAGDGVDAATAGSTLTRTLRAGETWQLVSRRLRRATCVHAVGDDLACIGALPDLSGSVIESDHPVAVFAGHDCAFVPTNHGSCDHLEEQLFPSESLGRRYVIARDMTLQRRPEPMIVRLVSQAAANLVRFDPPSVHAPVTLGEGDVLDLTSTETFSVESSAPLAVAKFHVGLAYWQTNAYVFGPTYYGVLGDPSFTLVPPVEQWRADYLFSVPTTFARNVAGVVVAHGAELLIDDAPPRAQPSTVGAWDVYNLELVGQSGVHQMRTSGAQPFALTLYGFGPFTAYMVPGGLNLAILPPV